MAGKHYAESQEIERLQRLVQLKDREILDIKVECATQFKEIKKICFENEYGGLNDKAKKIKKIEDIAQFNISALEDDIKIELPTNRKVSK